MAANGRRVAIIDGVRTPFARAFTVYKKTHPAELGRMAVNELLDRTGIDLEEIDGVVFGNTIAPIAGPNVAREIQFRTGIPRSAAAHTVQMYCASGARAIVDGAHEILRGDADVIVAGGVDSVSGIRALFSEQLTDALNKASKAKSLGERVRAFKNIRPKHLAPQVPGIDEPTTGLSMGQSADKLAKELGITRHDQDEWAMTSHSRAAKATKEGRLAKEIVPALVAPKFDAPVEGDTDIRSDSTMEKLGSLKPVFDRRYGTVTAGNASPLTDGGAAVLLMEAEKAKALGMKIKGYFRAYGQAGLDLAKEPLLMGPAYATPIALDRAGMKLSDIDYIEMHEAFAASVLAAVRSFESAKFATEKLGKASAIGKVDLEAMNANGGSIAIGHPFGATGARLVMTLLNEMERRKVSTGMATMCAAGGLGLSLIVERE
ncbi:MAG TPA: acetyl-CoA C-acyltransferase [bacterium]|nr:acetyl-CoA C-acyltransferase [bacterium]